LSSAKELFRAADGGKEAAMANRPLVTAGLVTRATGIEADCLAAMRDNVIDLGEWRSIRARLIDFVSATQRAHNRAKLANALMRETDDPVYLDGLSARAGVSVPPDAA
jgi:hypothetical protein